MTGRPIFQQLTLLGQDLPRGPAKPIVTLRWFGVGLGRPGTGAGKVCGGDRVWTAFPTARVQQLLPPHYGEAFLNGKGPGAAR